MWTIQDGKLILTFEPNFEHYLIKKIVTESPTILFPGIMNFNKVKVGEIESFTYNPLIYEVKVVFNPLMDVETIYATALSVQDKKWVVGYLPCSDGIYITFDFGMSSPRPTTEYIFCLKKDICPENLMTLLTTPTTKWIYDHHEVSDFKSNVVITKDHVFFTTPMYIKSANVTWDDSDAVINVKSY